MNPVITQALDAILLERKDQSYSASFRAADELIAVYGETELAERLFSEIPRTVPFEIVAELFDILTWQTSDNGSAIHRTVERWLLEGLDNRKLLIALHLDSCPFIDTEDMRKVLSQLAEKNPRVAGRCRLLIQSRASTAEEANRTDEPGS